MTAPGSPVKTKADYANWRVGQIWDFAELTGFAPFWMRVGKWPR